ncbi:MAG: DEAD/DEAH box helicase family protein [Endomicrobium sp.]|nr:DEAD/DEAH box helicase family protein [Endomicrobium sp.]
MKKAYCRPGKKILITTIQKLGRFIKDNKGLLIFDECHRSQFGNMYAKIIKSFKITTYLVYRYAYFCGKFFKWGQSTI